MTPGCIGQPRVKKLPSGYWHVRFGPHRFAQWRTGELCRPENVFGGGGDKEQLADKANRAVESQKEKER